MSLRVYKIKTLELDDLETFDLSEEAIMEWLELNTDFLSHLNGYGSGVFELPLDDAERMVIELKGRVKKEILKKLENDIKEAKTKNETGILYYVF